MSDFTPIPFRAGYTLTRKYNEPFTDKAGNSAVITYADYIDKKYNKLIIGFVLYVKWDSKQ